MNVFVVDAQGIYRRGVVASLRDLPEVAALTDVTGVGEAREHAALPEADVVIIDHDAPGAHELIRELSAIGRAEYDRVQLAVRRARRARRDARRRSRRPVEGDAHPGGPRQRGARRRRRHRRPRPRAPRPATRRRTDEGARANGTRTSAAQAAEGLTARERRVLSLIAAGQATREVASELSYSERTVKNVLHDAVTKLHARSRSQAVAVAVRSGLI